MKRIYDIGVQRKKMRKTQKEIADKLGISRSLYAQKEIGMLKRTNEEVRILFIELFKRDLSKPVLEI